jgi:hypothetical protein
MGDWIIMSGSTPQSFEPMVSFRSSGGNSIMIVTYVPSDYGEPDKRIFQLVSITGEDYPKTYTVKELNQTTYEWKTGAAEWTFKVGEVDTTGQTELNGHYEGQKFEITGSEDDTDENVGDYYLRNGTYTAYYQL